METQSSAGLSTEDASPAAAIQRTASFGGLLAEQLRRTFSKAPSTDALQRLDTRVFHGVATGKKLEDNYELGDEVGKGKCPQTQAASGLCAPRRILAISALPACPQGCIHTSSLPQNALLYVGLCLQARLAWYARRLTS